MATEQQSLVTLTVNVANLGVWDKMTGGDAVAKEVKYRPGGMGPEVAYTSLPSPTTVTVSRVMENERDWENYRGYNGAAGKVGASVSQQPLDSAGNPYGNPIVWTGRFLGFKLGNVDSTSDNPRMIECDISVTNIS